MVVSAAVTSDDTLSPVIANTPVAPVPVTAPIRQKRTNTQRPQ